MSTTRLRNLLLAIPTVLTVIALTVPAEHLPTLSLASAQAAPPAIDAPCVAPAARPAGRAATTGRKLARD